MDNKAEADGRAVRRETKAQGGKYASPWPILTRLRVGAWEMCWTCLCRFSPKPLYRWRNLVLRAFGCKIQGTPFVSSSAIIKMPWLLSLENRACVGPGAELYNLGSIVLREGCTIAQYAYLCGGSHDFEDPGLPLVVGAIEVGRGAFVGARAFIGLGTHIGEEAIVGACAVVVKDVDPRMIVVGNPARVVGVRRIKGAQAEAAD